MRDQPNRAAGRVAAQVALAISMILAGLIAIPLVRALDFPSALMPLGLLALSGASWWLLMVRPRWAATGLAVTAIVLPVVLFWTAPLFLVDPHEVPPGPNPETVFLFTAVVVVVYCIPALIASACAANATFVAGQESRGHGR